MPDILTAQERAAIDAFPKKKITKCPTKYVGIVTGAAPLGDPMKKVQEKKKTYKEKAKEYAETGMQSHNKKLKEAANERAKKHADELGSGVWSYDHMRDYAESIGFDLSQLRIFLRDHGYADRIGVYDPKIHRKKPTGPHTLSPVEIQAITMRKQGVSKANIAKKLHVSKDRVRALFQKMDIP